MTNETTITRYDYMALVDWAALFRKHAREYCSEGRNAQANFNDGKAAGIAHAIHVLTGDDFETIWSYIDESSDNDKLN